MPFRRGESGNLDDAPKAPEEVTDTPPSAVTGGGDDGDELSLDQQIKGCKSKAALARYAFHEHGYWLSKRDTRMVMEDELRAYIEDIKDLGELTQEEEQVLNSLANLHRARNQAERNLQWIGVPLSDTNEDWAKWSRRTDPDFPERLRAVRLFSRYRHAGRAIDAIRNGKWLEALAEASIVAADTTPEKPTSKTGPPRRISPAVREVLIDFERTSSKQRPKLSKIALAKLVHQAALKRGVVDVSLSTIQRALRHKR